MHPTVAALAGIPFTQPMDIGGPDGLGAGEMDAAAGPRFEQAFGMDLSPLFDQKHDERYETLTDIEGSLVIFRPHFASAALYFGHLRDTLLKPPRPLSHSAASLRFELLFAERSGADLLRSRSLLAPESATPQTTGELLLKNASYSQWPSCGIPGQQGMVNTTTCSRRFIASRWAGLLTPTALVLQCISPRSVLVAMG